jgi:hypothetical protein
MRSTTGGIAHRAAGMEQELLDRDTGLLKPQSQGVAALAASRLARRSVNTSELLLVLPRPTKEADSRSRYLHRGLKNPLLDPITAMGGFIREMASLAGRHAQTIVLPLPQSKSSDGLERLRVSLRVGERAIPVAGQVKETRGGIGFEEQTPLLEAVCAMMPPEISVLLIGERFYGPAAWIGWLSGARLALPPAPARELDFPSPGRGGLSRARRRRAGRRGAAPSETTAA